MKEKIGVITFHGAYNYGSFLQSYALQYYIKNHFNKECEIINYRKQEQKEFYNVYKKNNSLRNIIKNLCVIKYDKKLSRRNEIFENMIKNELSISKKCESINELKEIESNYTQLICGSDQIWNSNILDFDEAYLLSFSNNTNKISYAASMGGIPYISKEMMQLFKDNLKNFRAVSVREVEAKEVLKKIYTNNIDICVDPTLLLEKNDYDNLIKEEYLNYELPKDDYIFFYSICYNEEMINRVVKFASEVKLPIYMVFTGSLRIAKCERKHINVIYDASVSDFLFLVKNASYVFSSSFHGTVFSIIYEKEFFVINENKDGKFLCDERMKSLLSKIDLTQRMINDEVSNNSKIDYNIVKSKLSGIVDNSKEYLQKYVGNDNV